jgi:hypothetical protein
MKTVTTQLMTKRWFMWLEFSTNYVYMESVAVSSLDDLTTVSICGKH